MGKSLRDKCPRKSHATWKAPANRPDAVELVLQAERGRIAELLPLRHGRMARSAFTSYRGAALTMACDLATTPTTGHSRPVLRRCSSVQFWGLCHAGAKGYFFSERPGRNSSRSMGMGHQAIRGMFPDCLP